MAGYSHKKFACPFFTWDEKFKVHCEGGCVKFRDRKEAGEYQDRYCASVTGWKDCTVAKSVENYYERTEENAKKKN